MKATYIPYTLQFKQASGTSRGILKTKDTWFIVLKTEDKFGIGECGMFRGLSVDDRLDFEARLKWTCNNIHLGLERLIDELVEFPSIQFGLEMAFLSCHNENAFELFPSDFTTSHAPIEINGLIWMGEEAFMKQQIKEKIAAGFNCIKMKIGAIDFQSELRLLKSIRQEFSAQDIELRVDANGAFSPSKALDKLQQLSELDIHSIEQPIKPGQWQEMAQLCDVTPLAIALDEELIGMFSKDKKKKLLSTIKPQYIILKPTLIGGFRGSQQWIELSKKNAVDWWVTSALESNIGLNAIAQWTYTLENTRPQGLGTGSLFTNNFDSPLVVKNGKLRYLNHDDWDISNLDVSI